MWETTNLPLVHKPTARIAHTPTTLPHQTVCSATATATGPQPSPPPLPLPTPPPRTLPPTPTLPPPPSLNLPEFLNLLQNSNLENCSIKGIGYIFSEIPEYELPAPAAPA